MKLIIAIATSAAIGLLGLASSARAEMNTVELDHAMEVCRQHEIVANGQFTFAPDWEENCSSVQKAWQIKQGGARDIERDRSAVHDVTTKLFGGEK